MAIWLSAQGYSNNLILGTLQAFEKNTSTIINAIASPLYNSTKIAHDLSSLNFKINRKGEKDALQRCTLYSHNPFKIYFILKACKTWIFLILSSLNSSLAIPKSLFYRHGLTCFSSFAQILFFWQLRLVATLFIVCSPLVSYFSFPLPRISSTFCYRRRMTSLLYCTPLYIVAVLFSLSVFSADSP